jgi:hypothetical protein
MEGYVFCLIDYLKSNNIKFAKCSGFQSVAGIYISCGEISETSLATLLPVVCPGGREEGDSELSVGKEVSACDAIVFLNAVSFCRHEHCVSI